MRLDNRQLYDLFYEKDITTLNHANTVATSITFIEQNGLLSRGAVERSGFYQTPQSSDQKDKKVNVWNDIFLDTIDLHGYFPRQNFYGPVLFKVSIEFLIEKDFEVWVTKDNPVNWNQEMSDDMKYFVDVDELRRDWDNYERQRKMVTIRDIFEPILFDYVQQVTVDDPRVLVDSINLFNAAQQGIKKSAIGTIHLKGKFSTRTPCNNCYCLQNYLNQIPQNELKRLFLPKEMTV